MGFWDALQRGSDDENDSFKNVSGLLCGDCFQRNGAPRYTRQHARTQYKEVNKIFVLGRLHRPRPETVLFQTHSPKVYSRKDWEGIQ